MNTPNAKICPRCGAVVPAQRGVCGNCGRLFRSPIAAAPLEENKTMMFFSGDLPVAPAAPPPPLPRVIRIRRWMQALRERARDYWSRFRS